MLPSWLPLALQLHASPLSLPLVSPPLLPQPWLRTAVYNPKQLGKVWYRNPLYQENLLTCALCRYYEGLSAASARILGQVNQLVGGLLPKKSGQQLSLRRVYLYSGRLHHWFFFTGLGFVCPAAASSPHRHVLWEGWEALCAANCILAWIASMLISSLQDGRMHMGIAQHSRLIGQSFHGLVGASCLGDLATLTWPCLPP